jgi:hypothetical protein
MFTCQAAVKLEDSGLLTCEVVYLEARAGFFPKSITEPPLDKTVDIRRKDVSKKALCPELRQCQMTRMGFTG